MHFSHLSSTPCPDEVFSWLFQIPRYHCTGFIHLFWFFFFIPHFLVSKCGITRHARESICPPRVQSFLASYKRLKNTDCTMAFYLGCTVCLIEIPHSQEYMCTYVMVKNTVTAFVAAASWRRPRVPRLWAHCILLPWYWRCKPGRVRSSLGVELFKEQLWKCHQFFYSCSLCWGPPSMFKHRTNNVTWPSSFLVMSCMWVYEQSFITTFSLLWHIAPVCCCCYFPPCFHHCTHVILIASTEYVATCCVAFRLHHKEVFPLPYETNLANLATMKLHCLVPPLPVKAYN